MDANELRSIISQKENVKLDFKRLYRLEKNAPSGSDPKLWAAFFNGQWDELIKDVIAITNGNVGTVNQVGRLIIGAGDKLGPDGTRELYDTTDLNLSVQQLLARVNDVCEPPIADIIHERIELDGKMIQVISTPPSPHVHEINRQLTTVKGDFDSAGKLVKLGPPKTYTEYTVFVREGENIHPASSRIRRALETDKGYGLAALNENLRAETTKNLFNLLSKSGGKIHDSSRITSRFRHDLVLDLSNDAPVPLTKENLQRLAVAVVSIGGVRHRISTQFLDAAIRSGEYLRYDFSQGTFHSTPFLDRLYELQDSVGELARASDSFDLGTFITKYNPASMTSRGTNVKILDLIPALALLNAHENVIRLSSALFAFFAGDESAIENVNLISITSMLAAGEDAKEEKLTEPDLMAWLIEQRSRLA